MLARLAFLLLLIAPPIALAADAPPGGKITVVPQPPKAAAAPARASAAASSPLPAAAASLASADPSSCRMDCAQTYYFCRAGEDTEACSPSWSQCVAGCTSPALASPLPAAP
jgi:hypothetical protein